MKFFTILTLFFGLIGVSLGADGEAGPVSETQVNTASSLPVNAPVFQKPGVKVEQIKDTTKDKEDRKKAKEEKRSARVEDNAELKEGKKERQEDKKERCKEKKEHKEKKCDKLDKENKKCDKKGPHSHDQPTDTKKDESSGDPLKSRFFAEKAKNKTACTLDHKVTAKNEASVKQKNFLSVDLNVNQAAIDEIFKIVTSSIKPVLGAIKTLFPSRKFFEESNDFTDAEIIQKRFGDFAINLSQKQLIELYMIVTGICEKVLKADFNLSISLNGQKLG
uniref:Conserved secreted protein n=1 Tax=Rhabditophanes sp. KR3021 TaxID=114890 RepID=A0AC35TQK0_9BILA